MQTPWQGRLASRVQFDSITTGAAHILTSNSDRRVSITFFAPPTGRATLSNEQSVTAGNGIVMTPGSPPITLWLKYHGDAVQREWWAIYDGAISAMSWIEALA